VRGAETIEIVHDRKRRIDGDKVGDRGQISDFLNELEQIIVMPV
jgi:hypothetical protein